MLGGYLAGSTFLLPLARERLREVPERVDGGFSVVPRGGMERALAAEVTLAERRSRQGPAAHRGSAVRRSNGRGGVAQRLVLLARDLRRPASSGGDDERHAGRRGPRVRD